MLSFTGTHEKVISSLFESLQIEADHKLIQDEADCCQICLVYFKTYDLKQTLFFCCGKRICESCNLKQYDPNHDLLKCPFCSQVLPDSDFKSIANSGKALAQYIMGCYLDSSNSIFDPSIPINNCEAFRFYMLAAKQGHRTSQTCVGLMYVTGRGVSKSAELAVYWLTIAARQGSIDAQSILGRMITENEIPGKTKTDAFILFHNAASNGSINAQFNLASLYLESSTNPDIEKALYWTRKAALQGHQFAQYSLAFLLFSVNKDTPTAIYWLRKAAASNYRDAAKLLEKKEFEITLACGFCCKQLNGQGKRCVKCKCVYYCTKECQVKDWKMGHKGECVSEITE